MMSKFIEVHGKDNGMPVSVNVENIVAFETGDIALQAVGILKIAESYDEVKAIIKDAGVLIHKADPRLNLTKPLTMDDLREMIGEPVWNSNTLKWELVWYFGDAREIIFTRDCGADYEYDADDLIKTPLYRMKQEIA